MKTTNSIWHDRVTSDERCEHCAAGKAGHYACYEGEWCQDCQDDAQTAAEDISAGYGPNGEDTGYDW